MKSPRALYEARGPIGVRSDPACAGTTAEANPTGRLRCAPPASARLSPDLGTETSPGRVPLFVLARRVQLGVRGGAVEFFGRTYTRSRHQIAGDGSTRQST
jgi:hypothetical protein